jgi:hypothetical protein
MGCSDFKTEQQAQHWLNKDQNSPNADDLNNNDNDIECGDCKFQTGQ